MVLEKGILTHQVVDFIHDKRTSASCYQRTVVGEFLGVVYVETSRMALVVVTGIVLVKLLVIKIPTIGGIFVFVEIIGQAQFQFAVFRKRMFVIQTCGKNVASVLVEGIEAICL